jgi:hypothetical protein
MSTTLKDFTALKGMLNHQAQERRFERASVMERWGV